MSRAYAVFDVFTDQMFGGNPLALVPDARGLDTETMQAITREFDFSETIFLLPPEDAANHLKARIFTPGREIPFAGHPNIGLGVWAVETGEAFGRPITDALRAEEGAGLVVLDLDRSGERPHATLTAPAPFALGRAFSAERAAAAGGIEAGDIATERHAPTYASVGMDFMILELKSREALARARPVADAFDDLSVDDGLHEALYYVRDGANVAMRMFAPPHNIPEDPATGSAAAALTALCAHLELGADAVVELQITQGDEMGRPSRIVAEARKAGGVVQAVRVGGTAVRVMDGVLHI
ncbi:MAG: PhzF family phenazine biosynthesis protein [Maricaulaceae bacterium]|jgi:trans-2,3-dihydro-3-hydroxyanthranilate isomerase